MQKQRIEYASPVDAIVAVAKRLSVYETRYQMSTEDFFDKFSKGQMDDGLDFVEWANDYRHFMAIKSELEKIKRLLLNELAQYLGNVEAAVIKTIVLFFDMTIPHIFPISHLFLIINILRLQSKLRRSPPSSTSLMKPATFSVYYEHVMVSASDEVKMTLVTYQNAADFLLKAQAVLDKNEAANNLMLGICLRLKNFPEQITTAPYLATVEDEHGLVIAAVMTTQKLIVYSDRPNCGDAVAMLAQNLFVNHWSLPGVLGPSLVAEKFAGVWTKVAGVSCKQGMRQRIYELRQVIHPESNRGALRLATKNDFDLIAPWIFAFTQEALSSGEMAEARESATNKINERNIYLWEDGQPVSMAAQSRPTATGIAVNMVYTPPELRRRGYASACVAALSQVLLDAGWKFCCPYTDLSNPTSNHIYQQIGYTPVGDFNEYVFDAVK